MRSLKNSSALIVAAVIVLLAASVSYADDYHYNNILVGDRASGMGGAYAAVADDPSGMFHNPAGMVYSTGNNLSASANAFHSSYKKYNGVLGGSGWKREASTLLPNFFGVLQKVGKLRLGISYVVPDSIVEDQDEVFLNIPTNLDLDGNGTFETPATITEYVINFNNDDNIYLIGPSAAIEITDGLSVGLTVYAHYRHIQWILNQYITLDTGHFEWLNSYFENDEFGIRPIFGVMWSPVDKASLGLTISKTAILSSSTTQQTTAKFYNALDPVPQRVVSDVNAKRDYPTVVKLGGAYFVSRAFMVTSDITYHSAEKDVFGERESILNFSVGTEYYLNEKYALRAGLYSNFSSAPEVEQGKINQVEHIDLYGVSLSLSYFGKGSSLSLGGTYSTGSGDAQIIINSPNIQDVDMNTWTIFLSSSYSY